MKVKNLNILFMIVLIAGCQSAKQSDAIEQKSSESNIISLSKEQIASLALQYGDATLSPMASTIRVQGKVDLPPQNLISVNFPMGGYLKQTKLIPGMHVSKGEVIATIEDNSIVQLQQDYLSAKSRLELSGLELDRQKSLAEAKAGVTRNLQQAEAEYRLQSINVKSLSEKLKLIGIDPSILNESNIADRFNSVQPSMDTFQRCMSIQGNISSQQRPYLSSLIRKTFMLHLHCLKKIFLT